MTPPLPCCHFTDGKMRLQEDDLPKDSQPVSLLGIGSQHGSTGILTLLGDPASAACPQLSPPLGMSPSMGEQAQSRCQFLPRSLVTQQEQVQLSSL